MRLTLILSMLLFFGCNVVPKVAFENRLIATDSITLDLDSGEWRCCVAHGTKDGWFECDFKGVYYPYHVFDTTIKKWFIKVDKNCDSIYYFRTDVEEIYIWNGDGYELHFGDDASMTRYDKYNGSDTLRIIKQVWEPKNNK